MGLDTRAVDVNRMIDRERGSRIDGRYSKNNSPHFIVDVDGGTRGDNVAIAKIKETRDRPGEYRAGGERGIGRLDSRNNTASQAIDKVFCEAFIQAALNEWLEKGRPRFRTKDVKTGIVRKRKGRRARLLLACTMERYQKEEEGAIGR
ncbi:uncharacterized protein SPSK_10375 [Sporothrix schenckii 1099-18]|uniref:Uncharacterized protein n=1 Tax=Sporothrix schenckii 1099-18 TaxID=1397361 RepID=A0A0F2LXM9_SPOSC|nr:uncharacterized protein SPSK_10375 [Sporothrix schenckii 1099-18]KJR81250.1 hypothetical protein SPSK_10375 [Sporothrix schenckii 1099-18]